MQGTIEIQKHPQPLDGPNDIDKGIVGVFDKNISRQIKIPKELTEAESLERIRGKGVVEYLLG